MDKSLLAIFDQGHVLQYRDFGTQISKKSKFKHNQLKCIRKCNKKLSPSGSKST